MIGVAVKVTDPPTQMEVVVDVIVTPGVTVVVVIGMALLVAVAGLVQGSLEVMITVTTSPSARVVVVKVTPFEPAALVPFMCH